MPDLITHLCTAQIARRALRRIPFPLLALGVILPDLLSRPFHILFPATYKRRRQRISHDARVRHNRCADDA
ncbi:MAG: hypothetical protein P8123_08010, partial [bacterium]